MIILCDQLHEFQTGRKINFDFDVVSIGFGCDGTAGVGGVFFHDSRESLLACLEQIQIPVDDEVKMDYQNLVCVVCKEF